MLYQTSPVKDEIMGFLSSIAKVIAPVAKIAAPIAFGPGTGSLIAAGIGGFEGISAAKQPSTDASFNMQGFSQQFSSEQAQIARAHSQAEAEKSRTFSADLAREFAQSGIRWRVQDAKAAGLHPLAALGGSTSSPSISVGSSGVSAPQGSIAGIPGQNLSRARSATLSNLGRHAIRMQELQLERAGLENEYLRSRIATEVAQLGPGMPVEDVPMARTPGHVERISMEPGSVTSSGWLRTGDGGLQKVPSLDAKERIEDQMVPEAAWALSNTARDYLGKGTPPPNSMKPKGTVWSFSRMSNTWYAKYPSRKKPYVIPRWEGGYNKSRTKWKGTY